MLLNPKPLSERFSMSLKQAYQMTIIAGVFKAKLNPKHELLILAERIDWERLRDELEPYPLVLFCHLKAGQPPQ